MANYADDIRRIAKQKSLKGGIGDLQPRDPIPGTVTPFIESAFAPANKNSKNPSDKTPEATNPNDPNTFNKGDGTGGSGNGGADREKNGPQDADDLIEDKAGPTLPDNGISGIFSGGSLNKITGLVDCDNGKGVTFNLDGEYIPPAGWDAPDIGPVLSGYETGYYWTSIATSDGPFDTYYQVFESYVQPGQYVDNIVTDLPDEKDAIIRVISSNAFVGVFKALRHPCSDIGNVSEWTAEQKSSVCTALPPRETQWPTTGQYQLKFKNGKIVSSQYDTEAPAWSKDGSKSAVTLCTPKGKKVKIRPATNGGTMVHEVDASGAAIGVVRVYNTDGTLRGAGDAAWIASQKPR